MEGNANHPPSYIEADSKDELRLVMLANNRRHNRRFSYFDIQFAEGKWVAWFEISIQDKEVKEALDGNKQS